MGSCCSAKVDTVAPSHRPYRVAPGSKALQKKDAANLDRWQASQPSNNGLEQVGGQVGSRNSEEGTESEAADSAGAILDQGSQVQSHQFVPWQNQDSDVACNFGPVASGAEAFRDIDGPLGLSKQQQDALHNWQRMPDVIRAKSNATEPLIFATPPSSRSICQGLVGDCSFLSALSTLAEYERKFGDPVLSGIIHPRAALGEVPVPAYNEYGKYGCRLFLNGVPRKVVIDDRVPVRKDGRILCAHSSCPHELWVTLLEKSFAKIMGGSYDMQGSNPGTDIFHLTGWVPETIPLSEVAAAAGGQAGSNIPSRWDEVFREASQGFEAGFCVVCVGTSELADAAESHEARQLGHIEGVSVSTGLVAHHAYPVLDCRSFGRHRLLRLKNPWGRVRWRGRFSPGHAASWQEVTQHAGFAGKSLEEVLGTDPISEADKDDGHFWIEWRDILHYFSHLYLSWKPLALGQGCVEVHGRFDPLPHFAKSSLPDDSHLTAFVPQYLLRLHETPGVSPGTQQSQIIWILLSRHVRHRAEMAKKYVAVHVYQGHDRLCCPDSAPLEQGVYSNGECALVKLNRESVQGLKEFVIAVSQHAHKDAFNFTIQVYAASFVTLTQLPPLIPNTFSSGSTCGEWTRETAGGCSNNLWLYFQNPQWRFEVPEPGISSLILFLECPAEHSVNLRLFMGGVARPEALRRAESSGAYRQGCCVLRIEEGLEPGPYVLVCSTFRPGLTAQYRMCWHADKPLQSFQPQPQPFARSLPMPLETQVHRIASELTRWGADSFHCMLLRFQVQATGVLAEPALACFRVVGKRPGPIPSLRLLRELKPGPTAAGVEPVWQPDSHTEPPLQESYAESCFAATGAAVILGATLQPGLAYAVEVRFPEAPQADAPQSVDVVITCSKQVAVVTQL